MCLQCYNIKCPWSIHFSTCALLMDVLDCKHLVPLRLVLLRSIMATAYMLWQQGKGS